jgi:1-deoxy-D-xylulose-5-phosphate reductoisomerase
MRNVAVLGATGSIGRSAADVIAAMPNRLRAFALAADSDADGLLAQMERLRPRKAAMMRPEALQNLRGRCAAQDVEFLCGMEGLREIVRSPEVDVVLCAISGAAALMPTVWAVEAGKTLALASKESMVVAGEVLIRTAREKKTDIIPVDSEHSAVFQALRSGTHGEVRRIVLTASGGPFRQTDAAAFRRITPEQTLNHPTWDMGERITVDSATLMNKALEVIEARWLFDVEPSQIEVVVHPQSIVHSMVEFRDGSVIAQMSVPDMRLPIQFALTCPDRLPGPVAPLDLAAIGQLTFEKPDTEKFPALRLGYEALRAGGTMPAVLNASDEVCVRMFLEKKISFTGIVATVEKVMNKHSPAGHPSLQQVLEADAWAREETVRCLRS